MHQLLWQSAVLQILLVRLHKLPVPIIMMQLPWMQLLWQTAVLQMRHDIPVAPVKV